MAAQRIQPGMAVAVNSPGAPSRAEFERAIEQRSGAWYATCLKITRSAQLAEDAVQDALMTAWMKRQQFRRGSKLETWIHRIAVNAALQQLRRERPQAFHALDDDPVGGDEGPEERRHLEDLGRELAAAFAGLTEIERVCFVLKHLEQWRLAEIADELEVTLGTVKQALFRAVRKLRGRMASLKEASL